MEPLPYYNNSRLSVGNGRTRDKVVDKEFHYANTLLSPFFFVISGYCPCNVCRSKWIPFPRYLSIGITPAGGGRKASPRQSYLEAIAQTKK